MPATNDYRALRLKESYDPGDYDFLDDPDYAKNQTTPSETQVVQPPPAASGCSNEACGSNATKVEIVCQFRSAEGSVLTTYRGSFDVQVIRVVPIRGQSSGSIIVDTVELKGQQANRPFVVDDLQPGDEIAVRFTNVSPVDANARELVAYMREVSA